MWYFGREKESGLPVVFQSAKKPTAKSHQQFDFVIGGYKKFGDCKKACEWMFGLAYALNKENEKCASLVKQ